MASMFERYGGFAAVSKIVMTFYDKVLDSDVAGPYFDNTDMRELIDHQTQFIAQVMGGPSSYTNEALQGVHKRHAIDREAFDEVANLLRQTLEDFELESGDIDRIMEDVQSRASYIISA